MLSFARRAFNLEPEKDIFLSIDNRDLRISRLSFAGDLSIGLRLVLDQYISHADSSSKHNSSVGIVLQKPTTTFKSIAGTDLPVPSFSYPTGKDSEFGDFLNSCHLCKKRLKSGEDVYMYMGDQGFCSVECRTRQISMDEMKEVEDALDRRKSGSGSASGASDSQKCPNGGQCETCRLLEDLRKRRRQRKPARR